MFNNLIYFFAFKNKKDIYLIIGFLFSILKNKICKHFQKIYFEKIIVSKKNWGIKKNYFLTFKKILK